MLICFFRSFNGFDHKKQLTTELFKNVKKILTVRKDSNQLIKYVLTAKVQFQKRFLDRAGGQYWVKLGNT